MRLFRIKIKIKEDHTIYYIQEKKLLIWVTIEKSINKESADNAIAEIREGAYYNWLLKQPR